MARINILSGKKPDDIYVDFCKKHKINMYDFREMITYIRAPKLGRYFFPILFGTTLFVIGLCSIVALIGSINAHQFPLVYGEVFNFFHRFVNTFEATMLVLLSLAFMVYPWIYWAQCYDWID